MRKANGVEEATSTAGGNTETEYTLQITFNILFCTIMEYGNNAGYEAAKAPAEKMGRDI
jgi:hypothetical protein